MEEEVKKMEKAKEVSDIILFVSTTYDSSACVLLVSVSYWRVVFICMHISFHVHKYVRVVQAYYIMILIYQERVWR